MVGQRFSLNKKINFLIQNSSSLCVDITPDSSLLKKMKINHDAKGMYTFFEYIDALKKYVQIFYIKDSFLLLSSPIFLILLKNFQKQNPFIFIFIETKLDENEISQNTGIFKNFGNIVLCSSTNLKLKNIVKIISKSSEELSKFGNIIDFKNDVAILSSFKIKKSINIFDFREFDLRKINKNIISDENTTLNLIGAKNLFDDGKKNIIKKVRELIIKLDYEKKY